MTTIESIQYRSLARGPRLIVLGAVHGNETCGTQGIRRVAAEFAAGSLALTRGTLTLVPIANPVAYARGHREGDRNLNRDFREVISPESAEDRIANHLAPMLSAHDVLLDLHSFSSQGEAFVFIGPQDNSSELEPFAKAAQEESLASVLGPQRIVHGWMSAFAAGVAARKGTGLAGSAINDSVAYGVGTTEFMRSRGGCAVTLECGNHADPAAPDVAYRAIHRALAHLGLVAGAAPASTGPKEVIELHQVHDRRDPADSFARTWRSFDRLQRGETIAQRASGEVLSAPEDGYIVFPNPNALPGREWFYFARHSDRVVE
ncbi:MAG: succinylglutamate desuccinylase/aspartoacylase family protein [Burkholderiaceae bacterium]|nr:succinylglutamate desuccinylase/aspartoacylase family protein [Burkholderiaceae bacterium]